MFPTHKERPSVIPIPATLYHTCVGSCFATGWTSMRPVEKGREEFEFLGPLNAKRTAACRRGVWYCRRMLVKSEKGRACRANANGVIMALVRLGVRGGG